MAIPTSIRLSAIGLGPAIDRALAGSFAPALRAMQARLRAVEAGDRGVGLVERALRGELHGGEP